MRIVYVGKHLTGETTNDDEGGITDAFESLGHTVQLIHERKLASLHRAKGDFLLFNHFRHVDTLRAVRIPKVFWCFDLVQWNDPTLARRNLVRREWIRRATVLAHTGFCTDGDWVAADRSDKLFHLPQGFNSTRAKEPDCQVPSTVLFTGISAGGGQGRVSFVTEMRERYGEKFSVISGGCHGRKLAAHILGAKVVVAPDSPVTNLYWSNRVYLTMGLGGFMLHPRSEGLFKHYEHNKDGIVYYKDRADLHDLIDHYTGPLESAARRLAETGRHVTLERHTYKHRVEEMLSVLKSRGIG